MGKVVLAFVAILLLGSFVSATYDVDEYYHQSSYNYDKWTYYEEIHHNERSSVILHEWSGPEYSYSLDMDSRRDYYPGYHDGGYMSGLEWRPMLNYDTGEQEYPANPFNSRNNRQQDSVPSTWRNLGYQSDCWLCLN